MVVLYDANDKLGGLTQPIQIAIRVEKGGEDAPWKFLRLLLEHNAVIPHLLKCGLNFLTFKDDGRLPLGPIFHHGSGINNQTGLGAWGSNFNPSCIGTDLVLVVHDKPDLLDPEPQRPILIADVYGSCSDVSNHRITSDYFVAI
jgi:hypothetical protein